MEIESVLILSAMTIMVAAYLFSVTVGNPYSEVWLDTTDFKRYYSIGEQVDFGVKVMNNLGVQNTYPVQIHVENLELDTRNLQVDNREMDESEISFEIPENTSFPLKVVIEIQGVDNLSLWIFENTIS